MLLEFKYLAMTNYENMTYITFVMRFENFLRYASDADKQAIYDIYKENYEKVMTVRDFQDLIDYYFEEVAKAEYRSA